MKIIIDLPILDEILERLIRLQKTVEAIRLPEKRKEWFNIKEAAAYLNMSDQTVRRLINRGLLTKSLGTGKILIPADSLGDYKKLTVS